MNPETWAQIIKLSLELALEMVRSTPMDVRQEQSREAWNNWLAFVHWLQEVFPVKEDKDNG